MAVTGDDVDFSHFDLHEFDSELDFSNKIGYNIIMISYCCVIMPRFSCMRKHMQCH